MKNAIGHICMGLLLMAVFGAITYCITRNPALSAWVAWAIQSAYWLGREVRDHEIHQAAAGNYITEGPKALTAFAIWRWNADGRKDFLAPAVFNGFLVLGAVELL